MIERAIIDKKSSNHKGQWITYSQFSAGSSDIIMDDEYNGKYVMMIEVPDYGYEKEVLKMIDSLQVME